MGQESTDSYRGNKNRRRRPPRTPAARSFATRSSASARFFPRREFVCMESPTSGRCCMCVRGRAGGQRGRGMRSMLLSRAGSGSVRRARHVWAALAHPLLSPTVTLRLGARATGWAAGSAGSRHGSERSRGSGCGSARPASPSPLSERGLSVLHPLRSSLGEAGEPSDRQREPMESGQNFGLGHLPRKTWVGWKEKIG